MALALGTGLGKSVFVQDRGAENLKLSFSERTQASTTVTVESRAAAPLKFDLFISPNGRDFYYTSSCPLMVNVESGFSTFEQWPHPIHSLAVGNIRVARPSQPCE